MGCQLPMVQILQNMFSHSIRGKHKLKVNDLVGIDMPSKVGQKISKGTQKRK